ncbi:Dna2/Cas4 domain-containing protein [Fulvivirga sp. RKSG066]|uniref:UvrD-helicase domain-containing protein n=1 Tax=Fulvivirga aurantia TaxID=2529383 RepID=UPI0012BBB5BF|nr:UvrD-helicase domain-containing protein [Fulvivirga aurantia]MTI21132.1 Dna2/Cas4 domain-containing protein [Fulvivirga aurantia]
MSKNFLIYKSSAGSGKTYTLAKSYLKLALSHKGRFKRILGVTFTNKATEEMKQRIIKFLTLLKDGEEQTLADELCRDLQIDHATLKRKAAYTLSDILHDYSRFAVVTIDSFFYQVIRAFAREMGLQGNFAIDLDTDIALQEVIDRMLSEIGETEHRQLRAWLTQFAEERVEEGTSWDFRRDIAVLASEVLKDEFKEFADKLTDLAEHPKELKSLKSELDKTQYTFENKIKGLCKEVFSYLESKGLSTDSFKSKGNGPAGLFVKFEKQEFDITEKRRAAADNIDDWITKTAKNKEFLEQSLSDFVLPKYNELIDYYDQKHIEYYSAIEAKRYFYTFGILTYITRYLQIYRDENDVMLISDLPDFLNRIIDDSDTPYIYEKVGSRFDNYLIDEFQDTSTYQWKNFKPLVKNATDQGQFSMVVGDAKQSIYRFRGGDWRLLQHEVKTDIGEALSEELNLDTNWRSTANIINFNNRIFKEIQPLMESEYFENPSDTLQKAMDEVFSTFKDSYQHLPKGKNDNEGLVELSFLKEEKEADEKYKDLAIEYTISKVEEMQDKGYQLRDMAILVRTSQEGRDIAHAFIERSNSGEAIPGKRYDVVSKEALYLTSSHVVQFIIAVVKWLHDEKNQIELANWYATYCKYLTDEPINESELYLHLDQWQQHVPAEFLKQRNQLKSLPLYELVEELCRIFELSRIREEYTYLQGFQDAVLDYSKNERGDIASFLLWWEEVRKNRSIIISDDNNAVKIITIHKSKGLEFPVVILPFVDWSLDKQNRLSDKILWCEGVSHPPFDKMPVIPLRYGSALEKTYWADIYYQEKLKNLLDSLNLLYVALTRPEKALFMASPMAKKDKLSAVSDLMFKLASVIKQEDQWDEENSKLTIGSLPAPKAATSGGEEVSLSDYYSYNWRKKIQLQMKDAAADSKKHFNEKALYGITLHEVLSRVYYHEDLKNLASHELFGDIENTVNALSEYFQTNWKVQTEVPILLPGGDFKRIDRINSNGQKIVLIDYKTGTQRTKDQQQMKAYIRIMREVKALPVEGLLLYLENQEIVKVEA